MASLDDLITKAKNSRLAQAIGKLGPSQGQRQIANPFSSFGKTIQKNTAPLGTGAGYGLREAIYKPFGIADSQLYARQNQSNINAAQVAKTPQAKQRLYNAVPEQMRQDAGMAKSLRAEAPYSFAKTALTVVGAGKPAGMLAGMGMSGALTAGIAGLQGKDPGQAFGEGAAEALPYAGINRITAPFWNSATRAITAPLQKKVLQGVMSPTTAGVSRRAINGLLMGGGNVAENFVSEPIFNGRMPTLEENLIAFGAGAGFGAAENPKIMARGKSRLKAQSTTMQIKPGYSISTPDKKPLFGLSKQEAMDWTARLQEQGVQYKLGFNTKGGIVKVPGHIDLSAKVGGEAGKIGEKISKVSPPLENETAKKLANNAIAEADARNARLGTDRLTKLLTEHSDISKKINDLNRMGVSSSNPEMKQLMDRYSSIQPQIREAKQFYSTALAKEKPLISFEKDVLVNPPTSVKATTRVLDQKTATKLEAQQKTAQLKSVQQKTSPQGGVESVSASNTIIPPEKLYVEGTPISKGQQREIDREWERSIDEYANGITRQSGGGVSVEPSLKTKSKIKTKEATADLKTKDQEYKEWQKQVFGESNVRTERKAIDALAKSMKASTNEVSLGLKNSNSWKDKPKILLTRETMERNFEDIMGADAPMMKKKILEPIFKAEADRTKFLNKERSEIRALGIKPRSEESALVQQLGEKKITEAQVRQQSLENADKIITAQKVLRDKYKTYLTELNKVLTRNGYEPIPERKDYFHHFEDLSGMFEQVGVSLKATDLPTDINGLSADFKPGKTFFNAALQRKGDLTSIDAITGMDKYLQGASNQMYHTDNIQRLRNLEGVLREKYAGTQHLTNFAAELLEYTNSLAGKKAMIDRAAESLVGRRIYAGANALKRQVGANMVGANVSSALTSFIPVTQTLATTNKKAVAQAALSILKSTFKDDGFIDSSNFLTSRVGSDRLAMTNWEKIGDKGFWLFKVFDNFTSQLAVRSKYLEGVNKGLPEAQAMLRADEWGRKTLSGRSAGEVPTLFNAKTLGFFTQFQLEVNNQISFMAKDIPRNFNKVGAASALAQLFVYSYLFNEVYEKATGRRPAFDPLGVAQRAFEDYTNPDMKKGQATSNLISNVSQQLPFASMMEGGRIPLSAGVPNPLSVIKGESSVGKEMGKLIYMIPPTGGGQIKKTVEGITAFNQGASTSPSGAVRFPIPQTPVNRARTAVFGQWSTPEAQQYIREGRNVLGKNQSETFKSLSPEAQATYYDKKRGSGATSTQITKTTSEPTATTLPQDKKSLNILYKDAESTIKSYASNKVKAEAGLVDKDITEYQAEVDAAIKLKKQIEQKYPEFRKNTSGVYSYEDATGAEKTIDISKVSTMPSTSKVDKLKKKQETYSMVSTVMKSDLPDDKKQQAISELGVSKADADYYMIASEDNEIKIANAYDTLEKSGSFDDFMKYLVNGRRPVNGKLVVTDGVITDLVNEGVIPYAVGKELKEIDLYEDGTRNMGKIRAKSSKASAAAKKKDIAARMKALNQLYEDLKKINPVSSGTPGKINATKVNTKALTFSGR